MFQREQNLYEGRIETFKRYLATFIYPESKPMSASFCKFSPMVPFAQRLNGDYSAANERLQWGKDWEKAWFKLEASVPQYWTGKTVCAKINIGSEALIMDCNGKALQALSVHSVWEPSFVRDRYMLFPKAKGGEKIELWLEAVANQYFGLQLVRDPNANDPNPHGIHLPVIKDLKMVIFNQEAWLLFLEIELLANLMHCLPDSNPRKAAILLAINKGIDQFNGSDLSIGNFRSLLKPELEKQNSDSVLSTTAVGHAHLDTAWLWPVEETIHKCARTFANQLNLMENYPEFRFGASMAQHYEFMKLHYPEIFERIKLAVKRGQWEIQGGMWVEADCNLVSGESMVRQLLYGKQFIEQEFGIDITNLWLPDVFGYSAAMPQILKKSGINTMITQKISWNQFNKFPHHSFNWKGIDGTEVLVHFPPEDNYNSSLEPKGLNYASANFAEKGVLSNFLTLFGIGDGGGGPTEEMIERGLLQKNLEGTPKVEFGTAQEFIEKLEESKGQLRTWTGELYLELHRGTYTTQAKNKLWNRTLEQMLQDCETLLCLNPGMEYPKAELLKIWKEVLLYQFHDIIPGSSIAKVYEETEKRYHELTQSIQNINQQCQKFAFTIDNEHICLVNTRSVPMLGPIRVSAELCPTIPLDSDGNRINCNIDTNGEVCLMVDVPPLSFKILTKGSEAVKEMKSVRQLVLENNEVRYEFASNGWLISAFDKEAEREIMLPGQLGNQLKLYEDRPVDWDAWDIDIYYEKQLLQIGEAWQYEYFEGEACNELVFSYSIGESTVEQVISLPAKGKRLDVNHEVEWEERHKMLRLSFEVDVFSESASFDIQSGYVKRPTHRNTSWDFARFESVGHRYADLSEPDYGVALLNNCKYGYKIHNNTLDINLLRSPTNPDPFADRGVHNFMVSLLPHTGNLVNSDVFVHATNLNAAPLCVNGFPLSETVFPISTSEYCGIRIDAIKKQENGKGIVIRLVEERGVRTKARFKLQSSIAKAWETNLMEKEPNKLDINQQEIALNFKPFEIKTIVLE